MDEHPEHDDRRRHHRRRVEVAPATENGFAALGLRANCSKALEDLGLRRAHPDPARDHPLPARRAGTCSARPPPAPARRQRSRSPALELVPRRRAATRPSALVLVPTRELAMQVSEAFFRYGKDLGAKCVPVYGGTADLPPAAGARPRRAHRGRHPRPRASTTSAAVRCRSTRSRWSCSTRPTRCWTWASPTTSRASSRPSRTTHQTVLFSATMPPRINSIAKRYQTDPVQHQRRPRRHHRQHGQGAPDRLRRAPRPQAGRARPRARHRGARRRAGLLPHPHRGRPAHRDDERPRLPRRGTARRHGPGAARPGDEPPPRRHRRAARGHRRRRPRSRRRHAHARRQLRRAVGTGELRAPHRPRRPRRPRGRGHHARRAARAAAAAEHRAPHQAADRHREGADRSPTCAPRSSSRP